MVEATDEDIALLLPSCQNRGCNEEYLSTTRLQHPQLKHKAACCWNIFNSRCKTVVFTILVLCAIRLVSPYFVTLHMLPDQQQQQDQQRRRDDDLLEVARTTNMASFASTTDRILSVQSLFDLENKATKTVLKPKKPKKQSQPQQLSQNDDYMCMLKDVNYNDKNVNVQPMVPLTVFAEARTGSNLLFSWLRLFSSRASPYESQVYVEYEMFLHEQGDVARMMFHLNEYIQFKCNGVPASSIPSSHDFVEMNKLREMVKGGVDPLSTKFRNAVSASRKSAPFIDRIQSITSHHRTNPTAIFDLFKQLPTIAPSYMAFKIFRSHFSDILDDVALSLPSPTQLIADIQRRSDGRGKYIVLYRRRMIESFVSLKIAGRKDGFIGTETTKDDTIELVKSEADAYIKATRDYYKSVRQALEDANIEYVVLEYSRDLRDESAHFAAVTLVFNFLQLEIAETKQNKFSLQNTVNDHRKSPSKQKKDDVTLADLVTNWGNVIEWGYGGDYDEWENLFPGK